MFKKKLIAALLACTAAFSMAAAPVTASAISLDEELLAAELAGESSAKGLFSDEITDSSGWIYRYDEEDGEAYICGHKNTNQTSVTIPSKIGGYPVVYIFDYAFQDWTKLKTVVMPDTVEDIGICAFENCYSLSNITFSKKLNHMSVYAFQNCVSLKSVKLPDTVESIYKGAFWGCTGITEFYMPTSLDFISSDGSLFKGCTSLRKITFGSSIELTASGDDPFGINMLYIPPTVTTITANGGKLSHSTNYSQFTIAGFAGTAAQRFASAQGARFIEIAPYPLGDVDNDGNVNAIDASMILTAYAYAATNRTPDLHDIELAACDIDGDNAINSLDASEVLSYYAYTATGGNKSFADFLK